MEEERTINLKHLLYSVCKGWRLMLVWMLIFALLFTAFSVYKVSTTPTLKETNDKKIEALTEELTQREMNEVNRALVSAGEYVVQRDSIIDYLSNSYVLKNVMGEVPVTQFRFFFDNAIVPNTQYRFLVDKASVFSNQYRFFVERASVYSNQYRFLVERAMVPTLQFRYRVDNHFTSSMDNMTRDNLSDITKSFAFELSDVKVAEEILKLVDMTVPADEISRYVSASTNGEAFLVVNISNVPMTDEQKAAVQAYLDDAIASLSSKQTASFGKYDITFAGITSDIATDPLQSQLGNVISSLAVGMSDINVLNQIAEILAIDPQDVSKYISVNSEGSYLRLNIKNLTLSSEQDALISALLQDKVSELAAAQKDTYGDSKITFVGNTVVQETDTPQSQLGNVISSLAVGMSDINVLNQIAEILAIDPQDVSKYISVNSEGSYLRLNIKNLTLSAEQDALISALLQDKVSELAAAQKDTYGDSKITFVGNTVVQETDTLQNQLGSIVSIISASLNDVSVLNQVAAITGTDASEISRYVHTDVDGTSIRVNVKNLTLTAEQDAQISALLQEKVNEIAVAQKETYGDSKITFVGSTVSQGTDTLQTQLGSVIRSFTFTLSDAAIDAKIAAILGADPNYISECLSANADGSYLQYNVTYIDVNAQQAEAISKLLTDAVLAASAEQKTIFGDFVVTFAGATTASMVNTSGASVQLNNTNTLNSINNNYRALANNMTGDQKELYEILRDRQENLEEEPEKEGVSKKLIAIGAILGIFIAAAWLGFKYLISGVMQCGDDLTDMKLNLLGSLKNAGKKQRKFGKGIDKWLAKLFDKANLHKDNSVELQLVCARVAAYMESNDLPSVCLIGSADADSKAARAQLSKLLAGKQKQVTVIDDLTTNADALAKLSAAQSVVLVETMGTTLRADVTKELELCDVCKVKTIGAIAIG